MGFALCRKLFMRGFQQSLLQIWWKFKKEILVQKGEKCFGMKPIQETHKLVCGMLLLNVVDILLHHVAQAKIRKNVCIGTIWVPICEMK
jgi:hypothetical protein